MHWLTHKHTHEQHNKKWELHTELGPFHPSLKAYFSRLFGVDQWESKDIKSLESLAKIKTLLRPREEQVHRVLQNKQQVGCVVFYCSFLSFFCNELKLCKVYLTFFPRGKEDICAVCLKLTINYHLSCNFLLIDVLLILFLFFLHFLSL